MTDATATLSQTRAEISGAPETRKAGQPDTLAAYVVALVEANPGGAFTEIAFDGTERSRSYAELLNEARRIAAAIAPFRPEGDGFALLCFETVIDYVPAAWACLLNGFSFLPVSVADILRRKGGSADQTWLTMLRQPAPLVLTEARLVKSLSDAFQDNPRATIIATESLPHGGGGAPACAEANTPGDILIETSGTTGGPKLARLGGDKIINRLFDGMGPDDRVSLHLLVHTSVGGLRPLLPIGRHTIYLKPSRVMVNPGAWLDCVTRFGVTDAGMSSAMAAKINEAFAAQQGAWDASSLKRLAFGSETIVPSIVRRLVGNLESLGMSDASALLVYSMTETGPLFSSRLPIAELLDAAAETEGRFRLRRCSDSWTVRIVKEDGEIAALGETGRIEVRSQTRLFRGYYPNGEGPRPDGWFDTGDLGVLSEDGLLLTGREKATIVINARKISSEEIERCLGAIDGIKPGLVFAAPFREEHSPTDQLAVFFTPDRFDDVTLAALLPKMQAAVTRAFGVRISHLVPIAEDQIGRTATGKVRRSDLVERLRRDRRRP
jgi:acyl-CoA synthetase (AMP-forming)/AMP-acid ligase II